MFCSRKWMILVSCLAMASFASRADAQPSASESDHYSLVLVQWDLYEAHKTMTICDVDEDGYIGASEAKRFPWRDDFESVDVSKDGRLTHLEVSIWNARQRGEHDITQFDINNSKAGIRKRDKNGNGQLDPNEIAMGWPTDTTPYDHNSDGVITVIEYAQYLAYKRGLKRELGIEAVDNMSAVGALKRFDADGDSFLNEDEWTAAALPRQAKLHDDDGDSKLSHMELAILYSKHRRDTGLSKSDAVRAKRLIQAADFNRDGKLTDKELEGGIFFGGEAEPTQYAKFDANSDGTVTLGEIEVFIASERKDKGYHDSDLADAKRFLLRYDKNRSTFLESDEFPDNPTSERMKKSSLSSADENEDKRISLEELARHLAKGTP